MKIKEYILLIFYVLLFSTCSSDPEEKVPTALEFLAGVYQSPWIQVNQGNRIVTIEVNDSSILNLKSDNNYTLLIKATIPNSDSVIFIQQNGTFEITQSKYDKYVDQTIPIETLEGKIMFYPVNKNPWEINFSLTFEMLNFSGYIIIEEISISYILWFKSP